MLNNQVSYTKGILLVIISGFLWAINGNVGSYLFKYKEITPEHLTMFRLIFTGIILLTYQVITNREQIFRIFNNPQDLIMLLYFAFFGLLAMQYSYFAAVKYSNPATATILQSLAPFIIVIITSIRTKKFPSKQLILSLILAFVGVFLLVTHGRIDQLAITGLALMFGTVAALGSVTYNLSSGKLQIKYSTILIMGWAMSMSGIGFSIVLRPWNIGFIVDIGSIIGITYVVLLGTLFPFLFYLSGSKIIGPQKASILGLIEPVISTFVAVFFMGEEFYRLDYIGIGMVICALLFISLTNKEKAEIQLVSKKKKIVD